MSAPKAVAIVTGSDTVSTAVGCMESLRRGLPPWCDIVLAYSTAPACVNDRVRAAAGDRPVKILESDTWRRQNAWRNEALAELSPYDFYIMLDLDSRIQPGTLERCLGSHAATDADLVGGVILYGSAIDFGRKDEKVIHFAGGECLFRPDADGRSGMERIHAWEGRRLEDVRDQMGDRPWDSELLEYHGICLTRRAIEALTPLDTNLLAMENADLALEARRQGLRHVMDPRFEAVYVGATEYLCDVRPYREHWGREAVNDSVRYFATKYGLPADGEFVVAQNRWNRKHCEDIGVVTRPAFPAPPVTDLDAHPFARSWPRLQQQLLDQDWSAAEIEGVERCHDVGELLANGIRDARGTPAAAHLNGMASILAAYGAPPVLVEAALVRTAYDRLVRQSGASDVGSAAQALAQRVGLNVDRVLRACVRQDFRGVAPPETEDDLAFYPLDDARTLILRVASVIESCLDGANASPVKRGEAGPLPAHARKVLPVLGFEGLLRAFESAVAQTDMLAATTPEAIVENSGPSFRAFDPASLDALALPDRKWIGVASFLRREGREADVTAAPDEFRYLCDGVRREILPKDPWHGLDRDAILVLHKGRLADQPRAALEALMAETAIFANEVFVLFSRTGTAIGAESRVHLGPIRMAIDEAAGVGR